MGCRSKINIFRPVSELNLRGSGFNFISQSMLLKSPAKATLILRSDQKFADLINTDYHPELAVETIGEQLDAKLEMD